jgi:tetratricopeptide (TPR) repeat protein
LRLFVRPSGRTLVAFLFVLIPSFGFGTSGIGLDPEDAREYYDRGCMWMKVNMLEKAIADFSKAIQLNPEYCDAYFRRGRAWAEKKEYDKAISDYAEVIRLDPRDSLAYSSRGQAWEKKKECNKAIADYSEAVRNDPESAVALNNLAWLWATCPIATNREGKKAVESATRACAITEWKNAELLDTLAASYAEASDFDSALNWQIKANSLGLYANEKTKGEARLKLYKAKQPYRHSHDQT